MRDYRTHRPGSYQEMTSGFHWKVPASYNLAADVLDKHEPDRPAMHFVSDEGRDERWSFGDMRRLTDRTANTLRGLGVGHVVILSGRACRGRAGRRRPPR